MSSDHKEEIDKFISELGDVVKEAGYDELYGYQLDPKGQFYDVKVVKCLIAKLLKAYNFDAAETKKHLVSILKWRGEFDPLSAAFLEDHDTKFNKVGALTINKDGGVNQKVITWNFYGTIDDPKEIFGHVNEFIRWRVGLMEKAINLLDFTDPENDYMVQVHDYKDASLFSMTSDAKKASTSIIKLFGDYYPEVLSKKFFVNVPFLMSFLFNLFKGFVAEATRKKLTMMSYGNQLGTYINGSGIPKAYGGKSEKKLDEMRFYFKDHDVKLPAYVDYLLKQKKAKKSKAAEKTTESDTKPADANTK